jgi:TipAS antibiotic-recognition protein
MAAAEAHRQHISRWFYECTYDIHRGLTDMYVSDERFRANYDAQTPGLVHSAGGPCQCKARRDRSLGSRRCRTTAKNLLAATKYALSRIAWPLP